MRLAACLCLALLLAGCGDEVADAPVAEDQFELGLQGHVVANHEYRIQASFPEDQTVCVSASGTHLHGFHQWRDGDCSVPGTSSGRFISVWADYNATFSDWEDAATLHCGADSQPFDLGLSATGEGRFSACIPKLCGEQYVITASYLSDSPAMDLGDAAMGGGPDLIYTIALGTTAQTQEADLAEFRDFLTNLRLDGGGFRSGGS